MNRRDVVCKARVSEGHVESSSIKISKFQIPSMALTLKVSLVKECVRTAGCLNQMAETVQIKPEFIFGGVSRRFRLEYSSCRNNYRIGAFSNGGGKVDDDNEGSSEYNEIEEARKLLDQTFMRQSRISGQELRQVMSKDF